MKAGNDEIFFVCYYWSLAIDLFEWKARKLNPSFWKFRELIGAGELEQ